MEQPRRQDFRLVHRLRVRWAEVDQQRIVFNPHYLMYVDNAFTDYWRALGTPYEAIPALLGGDVYVKKSSIEYHASARLDDLLEIGLKCARIGNSSMVFQGGIFRGDSLLVSAELVYVFADPVAQTSKPVPAALRELVLSYEAGAACTQVDVLDWSEATEHVDTLRREMHDRSGPEWVKGGDASDSAALHALVRNRFGMALAAGRLLVDAPGVGTIDRLAVTHAMRGMGFGRALVEALVQQAMHRGVQVVRLSATRGTRDVFARLGFSAELGAPADAPQVEMTRVLRAH